MQTSPNKTLVCSRPGIGKTKYAIDYCMKKLRVNKVGIYFSLELNRHDLMNRIVNSDKKLEIIDNLKADSILISLIKRQDLNIEFIIIDYLQLLDITLNFDKLFEYTDKNNIEILITSQLDRKLERRDDKTPKLSDIREQDILKYLDEVIFLTKDSVEKINLNI